MCNPGVGGGGCFGVDTKLNLQEGGMKQMQDLVQGDKILSFTENGNKEYTEVYLQTHKNMVDKAMFCEISTWSKRVKITPRHFVVVKANGDGTVYKWAKDVQVGDVVFVVNDKGRLDEEAVMTTDTIEGTGYCNFLTMSGRLVADGILCSTYTDINPSICHPLLAPFRTAYSFNTVTKSLTDSFMTKNDEGQPYVFKALATVVTPLTKWLADNN